MKIYTVSIEYDCQGSSVTQLYYVKDKKEEAIDLAHYLKSNFTEDMNYDSIFVEEWDTEIKKWGTPILTINKNDE